MKKKHRIIIATRGSKLALWQANWIKSEIEKDNPDIGIELEKIKTTGDKILDVPLAKVGGKGLFVKEIEEALLRKSADLAVHSMKDVPTDLPEGLHLAAICRREDPRDALIINQDSGVRSQESNPPFPPLEKGGEGGLFTTGGHGGIDNSSPVTARLSSPKSRHSLLYDLPKGTHIGTSSLRRLCQLLNIRPDLKITQLRGNLDTRIRKLNEGQFDAIIVAAAGVKRLGMAERITEILATDISLPAIGQGAIGIECRVDDEFINNLLENLNHTETSICVRAERAFLKKLEGGCQVPIAAYARIAQSAKRKAQRVQSTEQNKSQIRNPKSEILIIDGLVGSVSGDRIIRGSIEGIPVKAESLGVALAEDLISRGAGKILAEVYGT